MSLLHPNEDDDAMAQGYQYAAPRKLLNRVWRLTYANMAVLSLRGATNELG